MAKRVNPLYQPVTTASKAGATVATVGSAGAVLYALLYLVRANTSLTLWPEAMDEVVVMALTAAITGAVRGGMNLWKNYYV